MGGASLNVCCFCDTFWLSMSQSAVVHARIDQATKTATEEVLEALGMTPTEAIRLFLPADCDQEVLSAGIARPERAHRLGAAQE